MPKPQVLFADKAGYALKQGFDQMAELLSRTLGPTQGAILNERETTKDPEILSDSAVIARRIIALPDRAVDVGAMLLRNVAWRVHKRSGDGVATAAVLAQSILDEAFRVIGAGGNAMLLRRGITQAVEVALAELEAQAQPVSSEESLTHVAETITAEPEISLVLGEMFDVLGPNAHITVEKYMAPYLERVYFDGGRWKAQSVSPYFASDPSGRRAVQNDCAVILFAGRLKTVEDVQPLLELLVKAEKKTLLLVTYGIEGEALTTLVLNHQRDKIKLVAVDMRRPATQRTSDMKDLAILTGATLLSAETGDTAARITADHLGQVKRAEASAEELVISAGGGDPGVRREQIDVLQARLAALSETDDDREELILRLSRLSGGVGVLKVGAHSTTEREVLRQKAEKAVRALRFAMDQGVVPGGGVAFLNCIPAVKKLADTLEGDKRYGALIVARALEAPFRQIVKNRGEIDPAVAMNRLTRAGKNYVYDTLQDQILPAAEAGLFDPVGVLRVALETAVSGAIVTLTTEALVLKKEPRESTEP